MKASRYSAVSLGVAHLLLFLFGDVPRSFDRRYRFAIGGTKPLPWVWWRRRCLIVLWTAISGKGAGMVVVVVLLVVTVLVVVAVVAVVKMPLPRFCGR